MFNYKNLPMQYTKQKLKIFRKNFDFFNIFAQNIACR